ncbi:hypothetical protein T4A_2512 [Trichinella pseudospiralis]|uniref:Uncharacterized protein n=1 Tax=Trichinella pseudospiralis TaxID=6337 RepID=A0A0V1DNH5_TRIPS|nr:hypothetical protein T4A_2512 [Trichinella pseudospiralis]
MSKTITRIDWWNRDRNGPGSANEFEKLIASKAGTQISIREA